MLAALAACAAPPYEPCPVELKAALPPDAFTRCADVLLREFGGLEEVDAAAFRLQSAWQPIADPPGERRASVFRVPTPDAEDLAVVVELRWLSIPLVGAPGWTVEHGDQLAERALAGKLREALEGADVSAR